MLHGSRRLRRVADCKDLFVSDWISASVIVLRMRAGLRYDDLYDELYDVDIQEALSRLPKHVVDARSARLKRAIDLGMKHVYLPKELQVGD